MSLRSSYIWAHIFQPINPHKILAYWRQNVWKTSLAILLPMIQMCRDQGIQVKSFTCHKFLTLSISLLHVLFTRYKMCSNFVSKFGISPSTTPWSLLRRSNSRSCLIYQNQVPKFAMLDVENTSIALPRPQTFQRLQNPYNQAHEWFIFYW